MAPVRRRLYIAVGFGEIHFGCRVSACALGTVDTALDARTLQVLVNLHLESRETFQAGGLLWLSEVLHGDSLPPPRSFPATSFRSV